MRLTVTYHLPLTYYTPFSFSGCYGEGALGLAANMFLTCGWKRALIASSEVLDTVCDYLVCVRATWFGRRREIAAVCFQLSELGRYLVSRKIRLELADTCVVQQENRAERSADLKK